MKIGNSTITEIITEGLQEIEERKIIIKVNSKGIRRKKIQCPPGRVLKGGRCVVPSGQARLKKKMASKKTVRTKKAKGQGLKKRTNFKRQKALKKRRAMGL